VLKTSISVVIPTVGRPELKRAVLSSLAQDFPVHEVLVVADTLDRVLLPENARVRILHVGPGAGGNVARQHGIEQASGELVALLDDDDEWMEDRLSSQIAMLTDAIVSDNSWVASSKLVAKFANGSERVWPEKPIGDADTIAQYIFRKHKVRGGMGFMQSSTLLFPRTLALAVPFESSHRFHQDIKWLLDVSTQRPNLTVLQTAHPTVNYHVGVGTVSKKITAEQSVDWAITNIGTGDQRTLGDFILTHSLNAASNSANVSRMVGTVFAGLRLGKPGRSAVVYACLLVIKVAVRNTVRILKGIACRRAGTRSDETHESVLGIRITHNELAHPKNNSD